MNSQPDSKFYNLNRIMIKAPISWRHFHCHFRNIFLKFFVSKNAKIYVNVLAVGSISGGKLHFMGQFCNIFI